MAAIKRPRETRNGRFWMLIELKKSCIGESDAGNQTPLTATKPRNARRNARSRPVREGPGTRLGALLELFSAHTPLATTCYHLPDQ